MVTVYSIYSATDTYIVKCLHATGRTQGIMHTVLHNTGNRSMSWVHFIQQDKICKCVFPSKYSTVNTICGQEGITATPNGALHYTLHLDSCDQFTPI